jgi:hypothetical protein
MNEARRIAANIAKLPELSKRNYLSHTLMTSHAATMPSAPSVPTIMPRIN